MTWVYKIDNKNKVIIYYNVESGYEEEQPIPDIKDKDYNQIIKDLTKGLKLKKKLIIQ